MWSRLSEISPVHSGVAVVSFESPKVQVSDRVKSTAWSKLDGGELPVSLDELCNFIKVHSADEPDSQGQIIVSKETLESYIESGTVISVTKTPRGGVVSTIISFPIELLVNEKLLKTGYSTHLAVHLDHRKSGHAGSSIQALIKWGYEHGILTGYHQTETQIPELRVNSVPITWWFRVLDLNSCRAAGFQIPDKKKPGDKTDRREKLWYAIPRTKLPLATVEDRTLDDTLDTIFAALPRDSVVITKDSVKNLANCLDCVVVTGAAVVLLSHLQFNWKKTVQGSTVALLLAVPGTDCQALLNSIYDRCKQQGSAVVYIPQLGLLTPDSLEASHAYNSGVHYLSWYNSGVRVDPAKFFSILF